MLLNCGVREDPWESLGLQDQTSPNSKGKQSWIFMGRADAETEAPILWPPDEKNWLIGKDPGASKDWRQEEKRTTKDEVARWHHQLDGHEFEQAPGVGKGQGSLACCGPWGCKESDMAEWLNWKLILASQVMLVVKNPSTNAGDTRDAGSIPGSGRAPGGGHRNPLQYSCLENPMDRSAWWAIAYRVAKSRTRLKQFSTAQHDTSEYYHNSYVHIINLFFCLFVLLVF